MLKKEQQVEVRVLHRQGKSIREIARLTGCSRNSVRGILRGEADDRHRPRRPRPVKLDDFKPFLLTRIATAGDIRTPATVLLQELRAEGYIGGYSWLTDFLRTIRPVAPSPPAVRFETKPGRQ